MTLPTILAMAGCIALLAGLFGGGITVKDLVIPKIANVARISSTIFGIALIGLAVSMSLSPASASQQPTETPTSVPPPTSSIVPPPSITHQTSSLISWVVDPTGVCRDAAGGYPRWSEYTWSLSQCQEACKNNPNCQGFAMSKQRDYCQLLGSDGAYEASDPSNPGAQITHGDSSQPEYTCYMKKH
jgi:hypothetical protein